MIQALFLLIAASGLFFASYQVSRNYLLGCYCFFVSDAMIYLFGDAATFGPLHTSASDAVNFVLLIAGTMRFAARLSRPGIMRTVSVLFLLIVIYGSVRGVLDNGIFATGVDMRGFIGDVIAMLYFMTAPVDEETTRKFVNGFIALGGFFVILACFGYAGASVAQQASAADSEDAIRVVPASAAEIIALSLFFLMGTITYHRTPRWVRFLPIVFVTMAIALQHRTIWNVLLVGFLILPMIDYKTLKRFAPLGSASLILVALLAVAVYGSGSRASEEFETSATATGTWDYRVEQWKQFVLDPDQTPMEVLLGRSMGTPYTHYFSAAGVWDEVGPHSEYVRLYTRVGIVGCCLYFFFMFRPLALIVARRRLNIYPSASTWVPVILGVLLYAITYPLSPDTVALLGVTNAFLIEDRKSVAERERVLALA